MRRVTHGASCPWGELSLEQFVHGTCRHRASCHGAKCRGARCHGARCHGAICPESPFYHVLLLYPRTMLPLLPPPCLLSTDLPLHPVCPLQLSWSILLTARVIRLNVQRRIVCTMYIHCAYNDIHMRTFLNYVFHPTKRTRPSPRRCP
jgi:hypothetical protein